MGLRVEQIVPRKRNHPSLAVWCGGNELTYGDEQPCDDNHPLLAALKAVVAHLDPDRAWLPTSPSGRLFSYSLENIARDPDGLHDVHGPWEYLGVEGQAALYNQGTSLLHSEFGVEGLTNLKTLEATIGPDHRWPVTLDNPVWHHLGAWWIHQPMWQVTFGEIDDLANLVRATQLMQAEGLRYALEAERRRKYHNSGTLPWQFNEPYPMAACTSAVDYYARPKPAYHAVARAYAPLLLSARFPTLAWAGRASFEAEVWLNNSGEDPLANGQLTARIVGLDGRCHAEWQQPAVIPANAASQQMSLACHLDQIDSLVFFLDLALVDAKGRALATNRYSFTRADSLAPLLAVPPTTLEIRSDAQGDAWTLTLTNTGRQIALYAWLEDSRPLQTSGGVFFDDNHLSLFPGETCAIHATWQAVLPAERQITLSGWNFARQNVSATDAPHA